MQRDANNAVSYGPAQLQAYIEACQAADELRDAQFPHGGLALTHPSTIRQRTAEDHSSERTLIIPTRCI